MPKYYVRTVVVYTGEIEAESAQEAELKGWDFDVELTYDSVYAIDVEELEDEEED